MYQNPGLIQGYSSLPQPPPSIRQATDARVPPPAHNQHMYPPQTANGIQPSPYGQTPFPSAQATKTGEAGQWSSPSGSVASPYPTPYAPQFTSQSPVKQPVVPFTPGSPSGHPPNTGLNGNAPAASSQPSLPPPPPSSQRPSQLPSQQLPPQPSFNSYPQNPPGVNHVQSQQPGVVNRQQQFQQQQPPQQQQQYNQNPSQFNGYPSSPPAHSAQNFPASQNYRDTRTNQPQGQYNGVQQMTQQMAGMSVNSNWNQMWNNRSVNLFTEKNIRNMCPEASSPDEDESACCDKDIMRPTLSKIPESSSLLQKSRLPFGILLHPFKDDDELPIIQDRTIVRCRTCRTYINPFVRLLEQRRWQCNLCNRVNDLPDDFLIDPNTKRYLEYPPRQPEIMYGSVEFIAPVEYMVRPPQPAAYIFVFDCSAHAYHLGYIPILANAILENLEMIPGDSRTLIGFIGFDSKVHFFSFNEKQATHLLVPDIEGNLCSIVILYEHNNNIFSRIFFTDVFLPNPENLLVNLRGRREVIEKFLTEFLPNFPANEQTDKNLPPILDTGSALGPALTVAQKILQPIGGRITVFQATLPNMGGEGSALTNREDPNLRSTETNSSLLTPLLNPCTDFYKKLALECSERQVAVDLFCLSPSYCDLASVSQVSKISGGSIFYYGQGCANLSNFKRKVLLRLEEDLSHYLTRNIGFEAVLRLRCTRGLAIHSFHGNCFVRSTDLLTLPNINPDAGFAVQISIEDDLRDFNGICFQAAVLYTNASGERRIRVHTLALPVVSTVHDVIHGADSEAIVGLLCKMGMFIQRILQLFIRLTI